MNAGQGEFAASLGIGVGHARRVTLVARGNQFDAGLRQGMGNLEIGSAEECEAAPCAVAGEVAGDHVGDNGVASVHASPSSVIFEKTSLIQGHNTRCGGWRKQRVAREEKLYS